VSAKTGLGLDELFRRIKTLIPWDRKPAIITNATFKRIKDLVLKLKEPGMAHGGLASFEQLRVRLLEQEPEFVFSEAELTTAVGHLANYGYLRVLRTSTREERVLLVPELLNNLAASLVLEARRNANGLGSLEEARVIAGGYSFPEVDALSREDRDILIDAATLLFLQHNICFRETDPLSSRAYLIFPDLINLRKPLADELPADDGPGYHVIGATQNVYASLVVLLGYTQTFTSNRAMAGPCAISDQGRLDLWISPGRRTRRRGRFSAVFRQERQPFTTGALPGVVRAVSGTPRADSAEIRPHKLSQGAPIASCARAPGGTGGMAVNPLPTMRRQDSAAGGV
jgi:hypothetical protein